MSDCTNVEMRESLPDLLHGRLDPVVRREVEAHLASCEECAAEFAMLRAVRRAYDEAPPVDVARIVAVLPRPAATRPVTGFRPAMRWQIAAALTMVTVGGFSVLVARRAPDPARVIVAESTNVAPPPAAAGSANPAPSVVAPTPATTANTRGERAPAAAERPTLTIAGGVGDLADDDLRSLLGALDGLDARPVTEPDSLSPIVVGGGRS